MISRAIIGNDQYVPDKNDVIGEGGEAVIFRYGKLALKIYHDPTIQRGEKLRDFFKAGFDLPPNVFFPMEPVLNGKGAIIGFTMRKLNPGCDPIASLGNKAFCAKNGITTKNVIEIFSDMGKSLSTIHGQKIVVGDINGLNEIMDPNYQKSAWIDVDSWQWGNHPCMVATESYLTPDLYGVDLAKKPFFKEEHDWFSFVVLLFRSLLRVHPFRAGVHPVYKSLLIRAQKGITVLDSDVIYPTFGLSPDILPDDLTHILVEYLKRNKRDPFPLEVLSQYGDILVECPMCHLWYAGSRKNCPGCQTKNIIDIRLKQVLVGCECEDLIVTQGKITFFKIIDKTIYCLADEAGTTFLYKKENGKSIVKKEMFNTRQGARFNIFNESLVVCLDPVNEDPELLILDVSGSSPKPVLKTMTKSLAGGKAVFSCSRKYLYRIVGTRIMRGDIFGDSKQLLEREVVQSLSGQTWFTVSPDPKETEALIGFYRVFGKLRWFLVRSKDETFFERFDLEFPKLTPRESLIDFSIKFSDTSVLILRKTKRVGIDYIRIDVVDIESGKVIYSHTGKVRELERYENIHGKAFKAGVLMHPTNKGVVHEKITSQQTGILADSDQFVGEEDALYAYGKDIISLTDDRVLLIKSKKQGKNA